MPGKLYVFFGEEEYSAKEALEGVKAGLGPREALGPNTTTLEGRTVPFGQVEMACRTMPFLGDWRLVVVEGLLDRLEERPGRRPARKAPKQESGRQADDWSRLAETVKGMPSTSVLVLMDGAVSAKNPLLVQVRGVAEVREFSIPRGAQLQTWIKARLARYGGTASEGVVRLVGTFSAGGLRALDSDIQKLCLYAGARSINEDDVTHLVADAREASIFNLVDAVMVGRRAEALQTLRHLLDQGATGPYVIVMVARQLRLMVMAKSLRRSGAGDADMMRAMGTGSDFVVRKALDQGRAYSHEELVALYDRLLEADLAMKTGGADDDLGLETLVVEFCARRRAGTFR